MNNRTELLASFHIYCVEHPEERFWQALKNWSGEQAICVETGDDASGKEYWDTYEWENRTN